MLLLCFSIYVDIIITIIQGNPVCDLIHSLVTSLNQMAFKGTCI